MLTLREAPALENTGAESIAGKKVPVRAPAFDRAAEIRGRRGAPQPRKRQQTRLLVRNQVAVSGERTTSFHALAKTSHDSETASAHSAALGDGSTSGRARPS